MLLLDMDREISTKETDTIVLIEFREKDSTKLNGLNALKPQDHQDKGLDRRSPAASFEDLLNECTEQTKEEAFKVFQFMKRKSIKGQKEQEKFETE